MPIVEVIERSSSIGSRSQRTSVVGPEITELERREAYETFFRSEHGFTETQAIQKAESVFEGPDYLVVSEIKPLFPERQLTEVPAQQSEEILVFEKKPTPEPQRTPVVRPVFSPV